LRVLEAGEFIKVGSSKTQKTNVRVVAASNLNMVQATREGRFREDLFYRLNTVPIAIPALRQRKEDIVLLFRKFASDFAEKYRMPAIKLNDDAKVILTNYYWNGNVRQLKNITEQISVIEQQREITAPILKTYLPKDDNDRLPALFSKSGSDQKTFNSEREILYQVLFDMKKDMNDLKKLVHDIMNNQQPDIQSPEKLYPSTFLNQKDSFITTPPGSGIEFKPEQSSRENNHFNRNSQYDETYQDAEEYNDFENQKPMTLEDMERQMIKKTLEKYQGKRKLAAEELQISERTLYRKIKEYGIE
jgi:DNA-binding NtrC family response regulator